VRLGRDEDACLLARCSSSSGRPSAPLLEFLKNTMLDRGYIGASELALLRVADDPEEVVKIIKEAHTDLEF
jgi:predicted Rossmann-fold nucleotide-binding protein